MFRDKKHWANSCFPKSDVKKESFGEQTNKDSSQNVQVFAKLIAKLSTYLYMYTIFYVHTYLNT